ncbi:MAG TPA: thiamine pyrophosphokinase [Legionellaceae bacterium]|nr:thiamine pyrophosphokinase [Legionellaceae bacterium]
MNSFIIVANGPFLDPDIIQEAIQNKVIIALDGAADKLLAIHILPNIILGDFDSIHPQTQSYWGITQTFKQMSEKAQPYMGHHQVLIVPAKDQSHTDLVKAIHYCDQQHASDISIICATGGREDHHEASKLALQSEYRVDRPIILHGEQQTLRWAENETVAFYGDIGDHCGFVAQGTGVGFSEGLIYACHHTPISLCNRLSHTKAQLTIQGAALLILPPQLTAQRKRMQIMEKQWLKHLADIMPVR